MQITLGEETHRTATARSLWFWAAGLLVAATAAREAVLALSALELHGDEAQYWTWSRELAFGYFSKPPVIAWLIRAATEICGDAAFCVRMPSPLTHLATALVLAAVAGRLYGSRAAAWTAIAYGTLPAVSFSSVLMSTDVPLLFFWSVALYAFIRLRDERAWRWAWGLGLAIGIGLLSKYAMVFFLGCAVLYCLLEPEARWLLRSGKALLVTALAGLCLLPNVLWNATAGWVTVGHTADNANWAGLVPHWDKMAEFAGAQFGVFGPVMLAAMLLRAVLPGDRWSGADRFLAAFSFPVLLLILTQALLSRAHANWAATAYCAATPFVASWLADPRRRAWLAGSVALHLAAAAALYAAILAPATVAAMAGRDPFARLAGWTALSVELRQAMAREGAAVLLLDDRMTFAALAHAFRDAPPVMRMWDHDGIPENHYELTRPFDRAAAAAGPVLLMARGDGRPAITGRFADNRPAGTARRPDHLGGGTVYHLFRLDGFKGAAR